MLNRSYVIFQTRDDAVQAIVDGFRREGWSTERIISIGKGLGFIQ